MSPQQLAFRVKTASAEDVRDHLRSCDRFFKPRLSTRVDLAQYSEKIARHATTFEAWYGGELIGLAAAYFSDDDERSAFLTSVSVEERFTRRDVARTLIRMCVESAHSAGVRSVSLEVSRDALAAIELYRSHGFVEVQDDGSTVMMRLDSDVPQKQ